MQLAIRTSSSRRARLIIATLITAVASLAVFASPAAAHGRILSGTVTGQLPGQKAEPLAEVQVTLSLSSNEEVVAATTTESNGHYAFVVDANTYDVRFDPPTKAFQSTTVRNVELTEFDNNLNLALSPNRTVEISGSVEDSAGKPAAGVQVTIGTGGGQTDAAGHFEFAVTPGEYQVDLEGSFGFERWSFASEDPIAVESGREIDLSLPSRHRLIYEVLGDGGVPIPGAVVQSSLFRTPKLRLGEGIEGQISTVTFAEYQLTDESGRAEFLVFGGTPVYETSLVGPPEGSGYGQTYPTVPTVEGDTTVVVSLGGKSGEDLVPPSLNELVFEPDEINVSNSAESVAVGSKISDEGSGLSEATITFTSPSGEAQSTAPFERVGGTATEGEYRAEVPFERFSEAGAWEATAILVDKAGNRRELSSSQLRELGFSSVVKVRNEKPADTTPPSLDEFGIEPDEIDVSSSQRSVTAIAHILDEGSGVAKATIKFVSPDGEVHESGAFERFSGTASAGTYRAEVPFEEFSEAGDWRATVVLYDNAGNRRELRPVDLEEMGFQPVVKVISGPPIVSELSPARGPEAGGTEVRIQGSGLAAVTAVHFGATTATKYRVESPTLIVAVAPPGAGTVDVTVTTPAGTSAGSGADRFTYSPPVTISSSQNPSTHGQKVTFTAKVAPTSSGGPTAQGTVTFEEGTSVLGVANLTAKGTATLNTTALGAGVHDIVASYSGDSHYGPGESAPLVEEVAKASTQVSLVPTLNPAPYGSSATLKATVKAVAPGAGTPAGTVTFREGGTVLATVQLSGATASLPLKSLAPGAHEITASYSGDHDDLASEAGPFTETVNAASTQLDLSSTLEPAPFGSSGTLKATVDAQAPGGGTPSGTVTFREGETILASVPLTGAVAKLTLKELAPGNHSITATYNGSADYEASEGSLTETITKATTRLTVTSTKNPAPVGSTGTIKATVATVAPGGGQATGTVTFSEGGVVLAMIPLSGTSATYPLKSLTAGTHEIVATYNGSANYESSSGSISQVISP